LITFNKIYNWLSKITHLSLHSLPSLINLKNTKKDLNNVTAFIYGENKNLFIKQLRSKVKFNKVNAKADQTYNPYPFIVKISLIIIYLNLYF